jgi:hypothetical protein
MGRFRNSNQFHAEMRRQEMDFYVAERSVEAVRILVYAAKISRAEVFSQ